MDRILFINVYRNHGFEMEMHHILSIKRYSEDKETVINIEGDKQIKIPMEADNHYHFMEAVYNGKEIWFPYIGYIFNPNLNESQMKQQEYNLKYLISYIREKNEKITFSVKCEK